MTAEERKDCTAALANLDQFAKRYKERNRHLVDAVFSRFSRAVVDFAKKEPNALDDLFQSLTCDEVQYLITGGLLTVLGEGLEAHLGE